MTASGSHWPGGNSNTKEMQMYLEGQWGREMAKNQRVRPGGPGQQSGAVVSGRRQGGDGEERGEHGRPRGWEAQRTHFTGSLWRFSHGDLPASFWLIGRSTMAWWLLVSGRYHSFHHRILTEFPLLPKASAGKEAGMHALRTLQVKTLSGNVHDPLEKEKPCFSRGSHSRKLTCFIHALLICHLLGELNLAQTFL